MSSSTSAAAPLLRKAPPSGLNNHNKNNAANSTASGITLTPRLTGKASVVPLTKERSPEYLQALSVLSEGTMSKACKILTTETNNNQDEQDDQLKQILDLYTTCYHANQVLQREADQPQNNQNGAALPLIPLGGGGGGGGGGGMSKSLSSGAILSTTVASAAATNTGPANRMRGGLATTKVVATKQDSNRSLTKGDAVSSGTPTTGTTATAPPPATTLPSSVSHTKSRPSRATANHDHAAASSHETTHTPPEELSIPPPSAINFLAKLNSKSDNSINHTNPTATVTAAAAVPTAAAIPNTNNRKTTRSTAATAAASNNTPKEDDKEPETASPSPKRTRVTRSSARSEK